MKTVIAFVPLKTEDAHKILNVFFTEKCDIKSIGTNL
jgi:hypothetical protein